MKGLVKVIVVATVLLSGVGISQSSVVQASAKHNAVTKAIRHKFSSKVEDNTGVYADHIRYKNHKLSLMADGYRYYESSGSYTLVSLRLVQKYTLKHPKVQTVVLEMGEMDRYTFQSSKLNQLNLTEQYRKSLLPSSAFERGSKNENNGEEDMADFVDSYVKPASVYKQVDDEKY